MPKIPLNKLRIDLALQSRAQISEDQISEIREFLDSGGDTDPIEVIHDRAEGCYWVWDGQGHRVPGYQAAGRTEIPANVQQGDRNKALLLAASANIKHGVKRTPADKKRQVEMVLDHPECRQWTDARIAAHVFVCREFVAKVREAHHASGDMMRTAKRGGKEYPINTGAIAGANSKPEAAVMPEPDEDEAWVESQEQKHREQRAQEADEQETVTDQEGQEVPDNLRDAFTTARTWFRAASQTLGRILGEAKRQKAASGFEALLVSELAKHIKEAQATLLKSQPWAVCKCGGSGCTGCNQRGWVCKS